MEEDDILSSLNKYFHYDALRPGQLSIIRKILEEKDVLVCKETGFGKSLCFQLAGLMREGLVVVVSPLLSRIERKCHELSKLKVKCAYLNKIMCNDAQTQDLRALIGNKHKVWDDLRCIRTSGLKFLYVTLDYLSNCDRLKSVLQDIYDKKMLRAIVIDELYYGAQWVDSFKNDYSVLRTLRGKFLRTSFLCFTGPLSQEKLLIVGDILFLRDPFILNEPSPRTNVAYQMMYVTENLPISRLVRFIKESYDRKSGLVYCSNKEYCETLVTRLKKNDISSIFYTDKLTDKQKDWINFGNKNGVVVVCLSGLPVDFHFRKIDFTIHTFIPIALEIFLQETSKVGKNGAKGDCVVLYCKEDAEFHLKSITERYKNKIVDADTESKCQLLSELRNYRRDVFEMTLFAENELICRQLMMLRYLNDENMVEPCRECDICIIMEKSFVVDMSFSLKKILMAIWTINHEQIKGVKSDDFVFASIAFLIDLLTGAPAEDINRWNKQPFFGSFGSWDKTTLHTLITVLLIQKFASVNLVTKDDFSVYQNLIITPLGQKFVESTSEFGIPFSSKDAKFNKWLNFTWVKEQWKNDLVAIITHYSYFGNFDAAKFMTYCAILINAGPGTYQEFKKIKLNFCPKSSLDKYQMQSENFDHDLFECCLMYHRILKSLRNVAKNNKAAYNISRLSGRF